RSSKRGWVVFASENVQEISSHLPRKDERRSGNLLLRFSALPYCTMAWLSTAQLAQSSVGEKLNMVYEVGELFELGIQLSYLLILIGLLGAGTFFVIRQVLVRRELDLSAKELQEQVRSGDASATEYFELGAVMLRRKFYPAAIKYLQQAIDKWDRDEQDLAQPTTLTNALIILTIVNHGVSPDYATLWSGLKLFKYLEVFYKHVFHVFNRH
ncbi:hypothetical protein ACJX0J_032013, partial [Zea mays]